MSERSRGSVFAAIVAIVIIGIVGGQRFISQGRAAACTNAPITVVASQEKSAQLKELAAGFCSSIKVIAKASGDAEQALASGWDERTDGPRPDVWSPASTSWVNLLKQHRGSRDANSLLPDRSASLMQSPLVLAMPAPMAEALGWPAAAIGWSDVLALARDPQGWGSRGHPEWGRFRLGKTDPNVSTSGLHALISSFFAATGRSADLTESDVEDPAVLAFVKGVDSAVVHYGETVSTFLGNLRKADERGLALGYVSAIAVEEKQVLDYNRGQNGARPGMPLVAVYPNEGTLVADHPYVVLNAPWVDDAKRKAAAAFLEHLRSGPIQQQFRAAGFRDGDGRGGPELVPANGLLAAGPRVVIAAPAPAVLARIHGAWEQVRKRARVLMVLDVSGSMSGPKIDLMKRAAASALDLFAPDDEIAVWQFSTRASEVAPLGAVGPRLDQLKRQIGQLTASGSTALYATTRSGVTFLREHADPTRINAVLVLTDGRNEDADRDLDGLIGDLDRENEEHRIRVFTIGYGDDADQPTLRRIAEASRAGFYDASKEATIDRVFRAVVSNF